MTNKPLTPKQEKFCQAYVRLSNGSAAYREAYSAARMKDKQVWEEASKLLASPKVAQRVREIQASIAEKAEMSIADWIKETRRLCSVDPRRLVHEDGRIKMPHELDDDTAAAIASFEIDLDGGIKYKFWDKNSALEKMGKHIGAFERDNKQKTDPLRELLQALPGNVLGVAESSSQIDDDD